MKNINDTIGNRSRDLSVCSAVTEPTEPPEIKMLTKKRKLKRCNFFILCQRKPQMSTKIRFLMGGRKKRQTVVSVCCEIQNVMLCYKARTSGTDLH